ncbi:amino acid adenylation domain-containing protein [Selenomonas ruminantium]|nr:non-ribosomal peptide synthetase [Selenomonas ruminantium]
MFNTFLAEQDKFNHTESIFPFVPVFVQIHQQALKTPDKIAVISAGRKMSYGELDMQSSRVANFLLQKINHLENSKDIIIGVALERSEYAYVAEQGILKAGAAFLPFVTSYPDERINFCLADANAPLLITSEALRQTRNFNGDYEVITIEELLASTDVSYPEAVNIAPDDLAYVIYTSGSTGKPKGVMIEQHSLANYVQRDEKSLEIMHYVREGRVSLALAAFSFDVSIVEEFVPLTNGCTVCIATEEEIHDPFLLAKLMQESGVNGITCTPTFLLSILNIPECAEALKNVDFYDVGAEAFPAGLFTKLRSLRQDSVIMNVYGPTECTMGCSAALMEEEGEIVVGGPMVNTKFYIVDQQGEFLPVGEKGELIICGDCVGRGYINLPDRTAKAFFTCNGLRAYHSGDLASWTEQGTIRIHGRIDNQIKLRGFRIELDEIEKVMAEFPQVDSCAVKVLNRSEKSDYLAGYFTAAPDTNPQIQDITDFMKNRLPEYMIPAVMLQVDSMPQTVNGKIDRKQLPYIAPVQSTENYVAPRNESEAYICKTFAEVLHLDEGTVSVEDDFFQLGGDSLSSMVLVSHLMDKGISSADVFSLRTVERLAALLDERSNAESLDAIDDYERQQPHKLSPMQLEMVDNQMMMPRTTMFNNMSYFFRFSRNIDSQKLQQAVIAAIHNHPALAMKIIFDDDNDMVQVYSPESLPEVKIEYMSDLEIIKLSHELIKPFKVFNAPLLNVRMFKSDRYTYLFFDVHHLAMDGSSLSIVLADIMRAYNGEALPRDYYCAYLANEEKIRESPQYEEDKAYFQTTYGGYDWCKIPEPDKDDTYHLEAEQRKVQLPFDEVDLAETEKRLHTSRSVIAIAAAIQALHEFSGKNDIMTNWIFNNRLGSYAANSVGMLIKNLPVGIHMDKIDSTSALLAEVKRQVTDGIAHSSYDYFVANDKPFLDDPMEVNYQLNINADELGELRPFYLPLPNPYSAPGARLELEFLENDNNSGCFESEFEWAGNLFSRKKIRAFQNLYIEKFISIVFG